MKTTLKSALNFIVNNNYFPFDYKIYKQNNGAPMNSLISGLLAQFILQPLETDIYKFDYTHTWIRYVDDIFIIWQHTDTLLDIFLNQINSLDSKIKFTLEKQQNVTLPYLDVLLIKTHQAIERTVYRKPITSQSIISQDAQALFSYKFSAIRHSIKRTFTVYTPKQLNNKINKLANLQIRSINVNTASHCF